MPAARWWSSRPGTRRPAGRPGFRLTIRPDEEPTGSQRIGRQIQAGTVWLNEVHQYTPHQVFGGHKQSGIGAENSLHGLGEYTNWQTVTLNRDPDAV